MKLKCTTAGRGKKGVGGVWSLAAEGAVSCQLEIISGFWALVPAPPDLASGVAWKHPSTGNSYGYSPNPVDFLLTHFAYKLRLPPAIESWYDAMKLRGVV